MGFEGQKKNLDPDFFAIVSLFFLPRQRKSRSPFLRFFICFCGIFSFSSLVAKIFLFSSFSEDDSVITMIIDTNDNTMIVDFIFLVKNLQSLTFSDQTLSGEN